MILVLHAYSRGNSGDGLLVDLTLEAIRSAIGPHEAVKVVALDPGSFSDVNGVLAHPLAADDKLSRGVAALGMAAKLVRAKLTGNAPDLGSLSELIREARLVVAVGGGYMRAGTCLEGVKTALAHSIVAFAATQSGTPTVYLPQSVGPFRGPMGGMVRESLKRADRLMLRDDRSVQQFGAMHGVERFPDLAVMKLASGPDPSTFSSQYRRIYLVARALDKSPKVSSRYLAALGRLRELLPDARLVVQSNTRGNDDAAFYRSIGWNDDAPALKTALAEEPGVVVSVRLHGSLQSLIAKCPSVHLSYERKGFGAFEDLGISEYVHQATGFEPEQVAAQAQSLCADASAYWSATARACVQVRRAEQRMWEILAQTSTLKAAA